MGTSWFALKGVLDQGEGSLEAWGCLGEEPVVVCRPAKPPSHLPVTQVEALVSGIYLSSIIETL